MTYELTVTTD